MTCPRCLAPTDRCRRALGAPQPRYSVGMMNEPGAGAWCWGVIDGNANACLTTSRGDAEKIAAALNAQERKP